MLIDVAVHGGCTSLHSNLIVEEKSTAELGIFFFFFLRGGGGGGEGPAVTVSVLVLL